MGGWVLGRVRQARSWTKPLRGSGEVALSSVSGLDDSGREPGFLRPWCEDSAFSCATEAISCPQFGSFITREPTQICAKIHPNPAFTPAFFEYSAHRVEPQTIESPCNKVEPPVSSNSAHQCFVPSHHPAAYEAGYATICYAPTANIAQGERVWVTGGDMDGWTFTSDIP